MHFASDNWAGAAPQILDAIVAANAGAVPAYGDDSLTGRVRERFAELFETDCDVYLVATGGAVVAGAAARNRAVSTAGFSLAAVGALTTAAGIAGWPLAATGAAALGGITGEMLLGHWYLVDPTLPRWALRRLDILGLVGLVADIAALSVLGPTSPFSVSGAAAALAVLAGMSALLMVMVWFALDYPAYSGVMAATGLSYLAVLTGLGAVYVGRLLASGQGSSFLPF